MQKVSVIIQDDLTAKEVNPYKSEIERKYDRGGRPSLDLLFKYQKQESLLRTFEIESDVASGAVTDDADPIFIKPGKTYLAQVLTNGKINILHQG